MDGQDKHRFVRQYVERQRAYLPTYTAANLENERHGTPPKTLRSDGFGFDTPVLRSRVPVTKGAPSELALQAGQGRPDTKHKQKRKRKKASTPSDVDTEHAARLADRRERKKTKRAIVNPPKRRDDAPPKKGTGQKVKKPAALALLYGFSATNVTKDRLTVRPAPSLGVFSKGRASAKKKVTATNKSCKYLVGSENTALKSSASRNEIFSECAFLNKPSAPVADTDGDSDDRLVSDLRKPRVTKRTRKDRSKCAETLAFKTAPASTRTTAESEVWDIEVQNKLPSSAQDVSSEAGGDDRSAPIVLDLRGAEWSASVDATEEHEERHKETLSRSLSATERGSRRHPVMRSSPQARSNVGQNLRVAYAVDRDAPSIHPSHSASQVGRRAGDTQQTDLGLVASKYFTEAETVSIQACGASFSQRSRSNDGHDSGTAHQDGVEEAALDVRTATWPTNSLMSVAPVTEFQNGYDTVAPLMFSSDCSPYEDFCVADEGYIEMESCTVETQDISTAETWQCTADLAGDDVEEVSAWDHPLAQEHDDALYELDDCDDSDEDMAEFLEGRALLLGVPRGPQCVGLSGLAQAEMDVARGLRNHWRPVRLW